MGPTGAEDYCAPALVTPCDSPPLRYKWLRLIAIPSLEIFPVLRSNLARRTNMSDRKPHDFIVRLEGLQLSAEHQHQIASAIQSVVMAELGKVDLAAQKTATTSGDVVNLALLPIGWKGILYRPAAAANAVVMSKPLKVTEGE
jgi:hypothetical protein